MNKYFIARRDYIKRDFNQDIELVWWMGGRFNNSGFFDYSYALRNFNREWIMAGYYGRKKWDKKVNPEVTKEILNWIFREGYAIEDYAAF